MEAGEPDERRLCPWFCNHSDRLRDVETGPPAFRQLPQKGMTPSGKALKSCQRMGGPQGVK
jgi:hypothetical protein